MNKRILKYVLEIDLHNIKEVELPLGSVLVKAHSQAECICLWFECPNVLQTEKQRFLTVHTGDYLPANPMTYFDTVFFHQSTYVVHVYKIN